MKAWIIHKVCDLSEEREPLRQVEMPKPVPESDEVLLKLKVCGICHTELDEIEGRTPPPRFPVVPGHQAVGIVEESKGNLNPGERVGVAWIYSACGKCEFCLSGQENLCQKFLATGRDADGGYAEYMVVNENFVYRIPDIFSDAEAAPLLCAGAIGYRSLALCNIGEGAHIGLTGFGASAHLVLKLIKYQYPEASVYVFARSPEERKYALDLGSTWAGDTTDMPPQLLDAIIDTTPVWKPVVHALECLKPGGRLVINAIRKESVDQDYLLHLKYPEHLWLEKEIKSVANVTRKDVEEFIRIAAEMPFKPDVQEYAFRDANKALIDIKQRRIKGAKVLII